MHICTQDAKKGTDKKKAGSVIAAAAAAAVVTALAFLFGPSRASARSLDGLAFGFGGNSVAETSLPRGLPRDDAAPAGPELPAGMRAAAEEEPFVPAAAFAGAKEGCVCVCVCVCACACACVCAINLAPDTHTTDHVHKTYICICADIYARVYMHTRIHVHIYTCTHAHMYTGRM